MKETGYIQIYTGTGKGKTTAAFGLAIRALCAGKQVFIGQFVKSMKYNEIRIETLFDKLEIRQFGSGCFIGREPSAEDARLAREGLRMCAEKMASGNYDLVILDELNIALHFQLLGLEEVLQALSHRAPHTEIVITGRYAPQELIDRADLVTDMQELKHYYTQGILSREGFDR